MKTEAFILLFLFILSILLSIYGFYYIEDYAIAFGMLGVFYFGLIFYGTVTK